MIIYIHWCAKIKDEVEKLAYQLNEEAERIERPIRRLITININIYVKYKIKATNISDCDQIMSITKISTKYRRKMHLLCELIYAICKGSNKSCKTKQIVKNYISDFKLTH
ncbi:UNVERIFIED_CONTAM: hypothetical protein NCL1_50315 [Trichonephila clavipes]